MAIPEIIKKNAEFIIKDYCETKIPDHVKDKIQLSYQFRGKSLFLIESRPAFMGEGMTHMKIAKFLFDPETNDWTLFCADRNEKWHEYLGTERTPDFASLLKAVDDDVTGIFWG